MNRQYPRSDRSSFEIRASGAFAAGEQLATTNIDLRDYPGGCAVWLVCGSLGSVTEVTLVAYVSDDGTTVPFATGSAKVMSDDNITDGLFEAHPYTMKLTTVDGTLVANVANGPFRLPQIGGIIKIGVAGNHASGAYSLRAQRYS